MTAAAYEPLAGRAKWAQRALIALVVLNAIGVVSAVFAYQLDGSDLITQDDLDRTDLRDGLVAVLTFVYLFAIVIFISWFRRAYATFPPSGHWPSLPQRVDDRELVHPHCGANHPEADRERHLAREQSPRAREPGTLWQGGQVPDLYQ